ncbi:NF-X1-type zinc finger protein NFXL1-like [Glandiceps talaboti]
MSENRNNPVWRKGRGRGRNAGERGGRGDGRGRQEPAVGYQRQPRKEAGDQQWNGKFAPKQSSAWTKKPENNKKTGQQRFDEVKESMQEAAEKFMALEDESDDEEDEINEEVLEKTLKSYAQQIGTDDVSSVDKTRQYLSDCYNTSTTVCLICIAVIKHDNAVWSCRGCFCMFHMNCIQNWGRHGAIRPFLLSEESFPNVEATWHCPKCRYDYKLSDCPTQYYCFCGKEVNPQFDPWLVPHSCGQTCNKVLQPRCGHSCLLLCHPGACPPCPTTVRMSCYCGRKPAVIRRCSAKEWSCGQVCAKQLGCRQHYCQQPCHKGDCASCEKQSIQYCLCGKERAQRPCSSPEWQCEQICNRPLTCGYHVCEQHCHGGNCGPCPRSGNRTCPCGKTSYDLPCTEDVSTCGDTCDKLLSCGLHYCTQRCHTGPCETCRHMTEKTCRCGARKKSVQCYKDYQCETKCTKMRDCQKHQCKRKCCDTNCPSCEQPCSKLLSCKNHKCPSKCHPGLCYPCPLTVNISCRCGSTSVTVPCGREKVTRPPRCKQTCRIPPDCHHEKRQRHPCHFGRCPPCLQLCNKALPNCYHNCPDVCHSAVLVKQVEQQARSGPWEPKAQATIQMMAFDCKPCRHPMQVWCKGNHQEFTIPCAEVRPLSCGRVCGRKLACTNHSCQLECHVVTDSPDEEQAGNECEVCEGGCEQPRPKGCNHKCLDPCHPGPCKACTQMFRKQCHCGAIRLYIDCSKWTGGDTDVHETLRCCQNQCPKLLSCGHPCNYTCHSGPCSNADKCTKKRPVRCQCQRRKRDFPCSIVQRGEAKMECDSVCQSELEKKQLAAREAEEARKQEELKKQQEELAEFERRSHGRKKQRRRRHEKEELSWWQRYRKYVTIAIVVVILAVFIGYLLHVN